MKKTLLLSVVASTMIMAGGDIAPVEPVVEAPAPAASGWEFSGEAAVWYQTDDSTFGVFDVATGDKLGTLGGDSLFDQDQSAAQAGIRLRATNNDVIGGIGAGFAVNGLSTLNLENSVVSAVPQLTGNLVDGNDVDDLTDGGWISEAYLTYGFGNTGIKAGRQTLPKSLSPFAYSENWNVFANSFDAVTVVNTDIANTTIVGGWIHGNNENSFGMTNLTDFNALNNDDGVYMLTVQNNSIENLTLTGSVYYGQDMLAPTATTTDDVTILWGDAKFGVAGMAVALQGGTVMGDAVAVAPEDTTAFGAQVGHDFGMINASVAYANINDGDAGIQNLGGTTSPLYTDLLSDQLSYGMTRTDLDKFVVKGDMDALGGNISAAYGYTDLNGIKNELDEVNVAYSVNITDSLNVTATYAYIDFDKDLMVGYYDDAETEAEVLTDSMNVVRVVARYNF